MASRRKLYCPCGSDQLHYVRVLDMKIWSYVSTMTCIACGGESVYTEKQLTPQRAIRALNAHMKKIGGNKR